MNNKVIFLNYEKLYRYNVINEIVTKEIEDVLTRAQHEEADTKITYHISILIANQTWSCVALILISLLYFWALSVL